MTFVDGQLPKVERRSVPVQLAFRFGTGAGANAYLGNGWANPEPGFVWGVGHESELTLPIGGAALLDLEILPHLAKATLPFQDLTVVVDGQELGCYRLDQPQQIVSLSLSATRSKYRKIVLRHPGARSPRDHAETTDDRLLAVALVRATAFLTNEAWEAAANETLVPPESMLIDGAATADSFREMGEGFTRVFLLERAQLRPDNRVLDIGSGNGQKARVLTRHLSAQGSYEGIDIVAPAVA